jgi:hypothetical protein
MGKGNCGKSEPEYTTECGTKSGGYAKVVSVMESIGLLINLYPACCFGCCMGDCCWCLLIMVTSLMNTIGSSYACCCSKNGNGLKFMGITSIISLILRLIMVIVLITALATLNTEKEDFDACEKKCISNAGIGYWKIDASTCEPGNTDFSSGTPPGTSYTTTCTAYGTLDDWTDYCYCTYMPSMFGAAAYYSDVWTADASSLSTGCEEWCQVHLTYFDPVIQDAVIGYLTVAMVISAIWLVVSIAGSAAGIMGCKAEAGGDAAGGNVVVVAK